MPDYSIDTSIYKTAPAILELSQAVYAEIERKLFAAGYSHLFVMRAPGSRIRMDGLLIGHADDPDIVVIPAEGRKPGKLPPLPIWVMLELSQAAYAEIERKLLAAGYEHLFVRGPGSRIRMDGLVIERAADKL